MSKKKILQIVDAGLWLGVIIPIIKLLQLCIKAYFEGAKPSFHDGPTYYGWDGFCTMFEMVLVFGFGFVFIWAIVLICAIAFSIFMVRYLRKHK